MRGRDQHGEAGWVLVEAIVSAAVLLLVVTSVLMVMDGSSSSVTINKGRSVASSLAEEDQERLKALPVTLLSNYRETREVPMGGVTYTVVSRGDWVGDDTGTALSCTTGAGSADYLQLSSTVTSGGVVGRNVAGRNVAPVRLDGIVAPPVGAFGPDRGTLATMVTDRAGTPTKDLTVAIAGPQSMSTTTNDAGCAVFGKIPAGAYQISLNQPGHVTPAGGTLVSQPATVTAGNLNTVPLSYDRAAQVRVSFDTKIGDAPPQAAMGTSVVAANPAVPPAGLRVFTPTPVGPRPTIDATGLYPFADGYAVFSGSCASADPSRYVEDYFSTAPGFLNLEPGGGGQVTVREPALNFQVVRGGNQATAPVYSNPQAHVVITPTSPDCTEKFEFSGLSDQGGLIEPGLPFGEYTVCVDDGQRHTTVSGVLNTDPDGTAFGPDGRPALKIWIRTSGGRNGVCT